VKNSYGLIDQIIRSWAIVMKDIKVYYAKGPIVLMGILWPAFMFISYAFGRNMAAKSLMPGLIAISVFFTCSAMAPVIFPFESQARTLERLASAPVAVWTILFGDMLASAITGVVISIVPVIIALAVGTTVTDVFILVLAIILGSICFATASLLISAPPTTSPQITQMIGTLVKFPLMFISGVFSPISDMPAAVRIISYISPLTYFTDLARYAMGGTNFLDIGVDIAALTAFTVVTWIMSVKIHNKTLPMRV
jgi:ABC-2 type transport system permease protein